MEPSPWRWPLTGPVNPLPTVASGLDGRGILDELLCRRCLPEVAEQRSGVGRAIHAKRVSPAQRLGPVGVRVRLGDAKVPGSHRGRGSSSSLWQRPPWWCITVWGAAMAAFGTTSLLPPAGPPRRLRSRSGGCRGRAQVLGALGRAAVHVGHRPAGSGCARIPAVDPATPGCLVGGERTKLEPIRPGSDRAFGRGPEVTSLSRTCFRTPGHAPVGV